MTPPQSVTPARSSARSGSSRQGGRGSARASGGLAATTAVLRSKLLRPNDGPELLERTRLIDALVAHADRPLALVVADAGYGKTTLLAAASRRLRG